MQQAVTAVQAKVKPASAERSLAPHVQAALRGGPQAGVQRSAPVARQPAPHVQAALQGGLQAKPQSPGPRPPAPHARPAVGRASGASPALQSARLPGARTVQARVPAFHGGISAVIQRIGEIEGKELVEIARSGMEAGPGNLRDSSKEARRRFLRAERLRFWLADHRDTKKAILDALCRIGIDGIPTTKSVFAYWNDDSTPGEKVKEIVQYTKEHEQTAVSLRGLAEIVIYDFVREKTKGGSCDQHSAQMFFILTKARPKAKIKIEKYKPVSNDEYDITPPGEYPFHRVAYMEDEEGEYIFDPWWPGGKFEKITKEKAYGERETVIEWEPSSQDFVAAFRFELEHHYEAVEEVFLKEDLGDEVNTKWTVEKK
ncbi:MAG: hypothetical protein ACJ76Y_12730 [Thermoanaerobaculia bacterium]